ncbi:MAG: non-canonical purine NTP pyrophosphatase [Candidatus Gracilibacteria bacterium]|nr:non-canonical purine NTP pyrophosphatase [Candidatus Gracilibacteria bacterium]MDD3120470.1 non-canonical purine NTP pyrophosphatase [Candidatus Gracilibacteria bacterium]MDD4530399.1 non-canonical purine NTP pyrophosphatase [Candidatus Gracilibacteria bacterium]
MQKLLIATTNPGKIQMFKEILKDLKGLELVFLDSFEKIKPPEENGKTVEENAIFKAKYYGNIFKMPTVADDGSFAIDDLNGEPGVMSRRWGGILSDGVSDEDWSKFYIEKVAKIGKDIFEARLIYCRCLYIQQNGDIFLDSGNSPMFLTNKPFFSKVKGFPLNSFIVLKDGRYEIEVSEEEKQVLQAKRRDYEGFLNFIKKHLF